jgi:hypothetical protein
MQKIPDYHSLSMAPMWLFYEAGKVELARLEALSSEDQDATYVEQCKRRLRTEIADFEARFPGYQGPPAEQEQEETKELSAREALDLLTDGFKIARPGVARELCRLLGVAFTEDLVEHDFVIHDLLSTRGGYEAGVDCLTLAYYAIKELGLGPAPGMTYSNRAMQAVANAPLLKQALHIVA